MPNGASLVRPEVVGWRHLRVLPYTDLPRVDLTRTQCLSWLLELQWWVCDDCWVRHVCMRSPTASRAQRYPPGQWPEASDSALLFHTSHLLQQAQTHEPAPQNRSQVPESIGRLGTKLAIQLHPEPVMYSSFISVCSTSTKGRCPAHSKWSVPFT